MKVIYIDAFSGLSGDKIAGALLSLCDDRSYFIEQMLTLPIAKDFEISIYQKNILGIESLKFDVIVKKKEHEHRGLKEILDIINGSKISGRAKKTASDIFNVLAAAEAKVHGVDIDKVHFHEVGAVDAIADIVSAAVLIDMLKIQKIYCSAIPLGSGFAQSAHGKIPIPAPATAEILKGVPVFQGDISKELTTPTGAAVIKTVTDGFMSMPRMQIEKSGYGAGSWELDIPNVLRIFYGEQDAAEETADQDVVTVLETNIDDSTPQEIGYLFARLFEKGALDVYITPVLMKKNRQGQLLTVLCDEKKRKVLEEEIFANSATFGIRRYSSLRSVLKRDIRKIRIGKNIIKLKTGFIRGIPVKTSIEYESVAEFAGNNGISYREALERIRHFMEEKTPENP